MFSDPFTCPVTSPLEQGWAELAALPQGRWEEARAHGSKQLLGFGSANVLVVVCGPAMVPRCHPLQQPTGVVAAPAAQEHSCAAGSVLCGDGLRWHGGDCGLAGWSGIGVTAGGGQAVPCVYIHLLGAVGAQHAPQPMREKP